MLFQRVNALCESFNRYTASARLADENDKTRAVLAATKDGAVLGLNDENGKHRAQLVTGKDWSRLKLSDENGRILFKAP